MAGAPPIDKAVEVARLAQIATLIKENQLFTALVLFCLWQSGAFISAYSVAGGAICG